MNKLIQEMNKDGIKVRVTETANSELPYDVVVSVGGVIQDDLSISCFKSKVCALNYAGSEFSLLLGEFAV